MAADSEGMELRTTAAASASAPRAAGAAAPSAADSVTKREPRSLWLHKPRAKHLLPLAAAAAALALAEPSPLWLAAGLPLVAAGMALRIWAAGHLVKNRALTVDGPYAHLRHPFYAGALATAAGLLLGAGPRPALGVPLLLLLFFRSYLPRKERRERAHLVRRHGAVARAYVAAVPAVWPRLEAWRPPRDAARPARRWSPACFRENSEMGTIQAVLLALVALAARAILG